MCRSLLHMICFLVLACAAGTTHSEPTTDSSHVTQLGFSLGYRCVMNDGGAVDCVSESPYLGDSRGQYGKITFRPVRMVARGATHLAAGGFAFCTIVDGALDCWNEVPATGKKAVLTQQIIAKGVTDISVSDDHACAVANGAALCWGSDSSGKSGHHEDDNHNGTVQIKPWPVIASGVTHVTAGGELSCAIANGALWCWGNTELANDPNIKDLWEDHPPQRVFERGVTAVAAGSHHVCAIVDGALWCWGDNTHGQIGIGLLGDQARHSPNAQSPNSIETFKDDNQTCQRQWNQLTCSVNHPVKVIDHGVTAVVASRDETCAQANNALLCWGANWGGQLGVGVAKQDVLKPAMAITGEAGFVTTDNTRTCVVIHGGALRCTLPCTKEHDDVKCPARPAFVEGDPTDMSAMEARVGIWRGTIGDSQVMACLQTEQPLSQSIYYYLRHRFSIPLEFEDNSGATLHEIPADDKTSSFSKPTAIWTLQAPTGDRMDGVWATADGSRQAPIHLVRVMSLDTGDNASCDSFSSNNLAKVAFNAPRVASQKLKIETSSDGSRQVSALDGNIHMTELPASVPYAERFNRTMHAWFAEQIAGYYDCALNNGGNPDFNESYNIDLLTPSWLVAKETYSNYCGGAHPSGGTAGFSVWNLKTGKTVNPWDFIKNSRWDFIKKIYHCDSENDCQRRPPPSLNEIIVSQFKRDNADNGDCSGAIDFSPDYLLYPTKDGLVFSTTFPHVVQACDEDITLPWKTVEPFLTQQGKEAMQSLRQDNQQAGGSTK